MTPAAVLVADPPWRFGDKLPGPGRGAEKHYPTLSVGELCSFPLPPVADDARLLLWRVASMQDEALAVARAWGFTVKSEVVWLKRTVNGKRWFGMGRQVRMEHEVCLIATRGRPNNPRRKDVRSTFEAAAGRHSAKPEAFYDLVESLYAGPYVELFARRHRPGWTCLGNELPAHCNVAGACICARPLVEGAA
jgi:N6-adenosine-specific RNA methylase IME4